MLIRNAADGNLYLYDMVNIKKETNIFWNILEIISQLNKAFQ